MNVRFTPLKRRNISKFRITYAIVACLVIQITIAVPPVSTVEATEKSKATLPNSIAVLPFDNLSPNPDDAYFAVGVHQEILDHLAKIRDMNVIARASVLPYQGTDQPVADIASALNVETIMKGRVRYADNRVNMTVQHIDTATHTPLWSETYDRELSDIFAIQAEIVEHIVRALGADLSSAEQARIDKVPTRSPEAYKLYMQTKAIPSIIGENKPPVYYQTLDRAIALDADFALAHAFKARGYALAKRTLRPIGGLTLDAMERAVLEHAGIALKLDPSIGLAHMALAEIHRGHQRETEARQAYNRALQFSPNNKSILSGYGRFLSIIEEYDEAIQLGWRVLALDPNAAVNHYLLGGRLMYAGKPAAAAEQFRLAIAIEPGFTSYLNLCSAEILLGNETEALKALRIAEQLIDDTITTRGIARLAYAYSRLSLQEDALRVYNLLETKVANGKFIGADIRALSFLAIGEIEKAYDVLSKNPSEGSTPLQELKFNMLSDPVLEELRFVELRKMMSF